MKWLADGWALSGIARFTSGLPVTLLNNNDTSLLGTIPNGINNNGVDTPEWSGHSLSSAPIHAAAGGFRCFAVDFAGAGDYGQRAPTLLLRTRLEDVDATVSKTARLFDGSSLEFRAEAFNLFNHAQFFGPASVEGNMSSGSFGNAVSAMPPRLMQLALRYRF